MHNSKCIFLKKTQRISKVLNNNAQEAKIFCREDTRSAYLASGKWSQLVV